MTNSATSQPFSVPSGPTPSGALDRDLPCRGCGYNLRGLPLTHRCPECERLVSHSLESDELRFAGRGWLAKLHWGTVCILWGAVFVVLGALLTGMRMSLPSYEAAGGVLLMYFAIPSLAVAMALFLVGIWLMSSPQPHARTKPLTKTLKVATRVGVVACTFGCTVLGVAALSQTNFISDATAIILAIIATLGWMTAHLGMLFVLHEFAGQLSDPKLQSRLKLFGRVAAASYAALLGGCALLINELPVGALGLLGGLLGLLISCGFTLCYVSSAEARLHQILFPTSS